ncbi:MAG: hypothetical protein LBL59_04535 [Xanthomonadaceae bacterium]|nr:hypothetical protein [Xanthomonadaceae bacterium]
MAQRDQLLLEHGLVVTEYDRLPDHGDRDVFRTERAHGARALRGLNIEYPVGNSGAVEIPPQPEAVAAPIGGQDHDAA